MSNLLIAEIYCPEGFGDYWYNFNKDNDSDLNSYRILNLYHLDEYYRIYETFNNINTSKKDGNGFYLIEYELDNMYNGYNEHGYSNFYELLNFRDLWILNCDYSKIINSNGSVKVHKFVNIVDYDDSCSIEDHMTPYTLTYNSYSYIFTNEVLDIPNDETIEIQYLNEQK